ncbi:hypothetical protein [Rathayibacter sp. VKM Ac-2805]|uniref:hypothetical protein n=1 Tax=Rathayibacter sp. VKM Ac-2805 TaxID=2609258 RepID=UPI0013204F99|nr:hypothetical protein [Rathayibacter sp. VKM Ac-2805]QHC73764.1 hypothetical protein GSU40_08805 [Rathayibacter sp. VKM Ac-2805]
MDDDNLEATADDIEDDLLELIQEEGMSEVRMAALGRNIERAYENDDPRYLIARVTRALDRMDDDKYARALRFALGISDSAASLSRRRAAMKDTVESAQPLSDDTIRRWERRAMRVLAKRLFTEAAKYKAEGRLAHDYALFAGESDDESRKVRALEPLVQDHQLQIEELRSALLNLVWSVDLMIDRGVLRTDDEAAQWMVERNLRAAKARLEHGWFEGMKFDPVGMVRVESAYKTDRLVKVTTVEQLERWAEKSTTANEERALGKRE